MDDSKWQISVPGKLMIAGEYAVLEPNQYAVVIAVNRYITAKIERSKENSLSLPQLGLDSVTWRTKGNQVIFTKPDPRLKFIGQAITVLNQFFQEKKFSQFSYQLTVMSDLDNSSGRKYGLGSSAAIVVAVIASILSLNKVQLSREQIFKLAALAHLKVQGNGSGADIAAAIFGGWIYYSSFLTVWILNELDKGVEISELIEVPWPNLTISPLNPHCNLELCVGWTQEVARTGPMVDKIQKMRLTNPHVYEKFLEESSQAVACLVKSFVEGDERGTIASISQNRKALRNLEKQATVIIETPKLKSLCDLAETYGSGKSSGAGGGDCGIALVNVGQTRKLHQAWEKEGILPLHLHVSQTGLIVTELIFNMRSFSDVKRNSQA